MSTLKKIPDRIFNKLTKNIFREIFIYNDFYGYKDSIEYNIRLWGIDDSQIERLLDTSTYEEHFLKTGYLNSDGTLKPKAKKKSGNFYAIKDFATGYLTIIYNLFKARPDIVDIDMIFKALNNYIYFVKRIFSIKEYNYKIYREDDGYACSDEQFIIWDFFKIISKKINEDENALSRFEDFLIKNKSCFLEIVRFSYEEEYNSVEPLWYPEVIIQKFNFSKKFLETQYENILISDICKNEFIKKSLEKQEIVMTKILENSLKQVYRQMLKKEPGADFVINEDVRDALILKFNLV